MDCIDVRKSSCCCVWFIVRLSFLDETSSQDKLFTSVQFVLLKSNENIKNEYREIGASLRK